MVEEIRDSFLNQFMRDKLSSKGRLLADCRDQEGWPTTGLRIDVPDYLGRDYKVLTEYGFRMWRAHGEGTRRYVKYDGDNYGLYLELRLPGAQSYLRITPQMARSFLEEREREKINCVRQELTARLAPSVSKSNLVPIGQERPSTHRTTNNNVITNFLTLSGTAPTTMEDIEEASGVDEPTADTNNIWRPPPPTPSQ